MSERKGQGEVQPYSPGLHSERARPQRERLLQVARIVGGVIIFASSIGISHYLGRESREPDNHLAVAVGEEFTDTKSLALAGICEEDLIAAIDHLQQVEAATDRSNPSSPEIQAPFIIPRFERHLDTMRRVDCASSGELLDEVEGYFPLASDVG